MSRMRVATAALAVATIVGVIFAGPAHAAGKSTMNVPRRL